MIHLDTNALIDFHRSNSRCREWLIAQVERGRPVRSSVVAWFEYLCGPVGEPEKTLSWQLIEAAPVELTADMAELAARFFNRTGRRRGSYGDCLIAATAVFDGADLLTFNRTDFLKFQPLGLRIAETSAN
jgi:predicted nucleic acid-binding protein